MPMPDPRVVIVGTTADYIDAVRNSYPGRALFVTATDERSAAKEPAPHPQEELLCNLEDFEKVASFLNTHLLQWKLKAAGVACFDCESLELAAYIAGKLSLPFPSPTSVANCRNKFLSKQIWQGNQIPCPRAEVIRGDVDISETMARLHFPAIIKPLTGSGSELVFKCNTYGEVKTAVEIIRTRLANHQNQRMYRRFKHGKTIFNSRSELLMETFIEGNEFSCDFLIDGNMLQTIRIAAKIPAIDQATGTTLAYVVPGAIPGVLAQEQLNRLLLRAARVLGLKRSLGMADFIMHRDKAYLLELTPRPGGDCLPPLIRASSGLDMIGLTMDFAEGKPLRIPEKISWEKLVGMRIFAESAGIVRHIDASRLKQDNSVRSYVLKAHSGYRVKYPPEDYDSRLLGYVIFKPHPEQSIEFHCREIRSKIKIAIED